MAFCSAAHASSSLSPLGEMNFLKELCEFKKADEETTTAHPSSPAREKKPLSIGNLW